tara:strand:- start:353 stop:1780 length:1428 start_codon:yes stop_codon:yes gene_type:complete
MDISFLDNYKKKFYFLILIIGLGLFLRLYNINFEDLWFDEQAGFLVADPKLNITETILLSKNQDNGTSLFFNLILKKFFELFGYDPDIGRILTVFIGVLSIPALCYLTYQIKKNNGFILVAFLSSINWYLISYSQELRPYSLLFLLSILSVIFFFKFIDEDKKIINLNFFLFVLFTSLAAATHIFFFIVIFSQFIFLIVNKFEIKHFFYTKLFGLVLIPLIYLFIMYDYLILQLQLGNQDFWVQQVKLEFFINFFFSRYFGSKIMGSIYLLTLIYLIVIHRKEVFKSSSKYFFLFLILFFSYFLPLIYSLFKQPILTDRYIIFILIPILILISSLILEIRIYKVKIFLLVLLLLSTITNNYIEIFQREVSKPEFKNAIKYIINSKTNNNIFVLTEHKIHQEIVSNYTKAVISKENFNFNFLDEIKEDDINEFWMICYEPLNQFKCNPAEIITDNFIKKDQIKLKLINATLYNKNL